MMRQRSTSRAGGPSALERVVFLVLLAAVMACGLGSCIHVAALSAALLR